MKAANKFAAHPVILDFDFADIRILEALSLRPLPDPYRDFEAFFAAAGYLSDALPRSIREGVAAFGRYGNNDGALLLRAFPQDPELPLTPIQAHAQVVDGARLSELWMCSVAALLGEPFAYRQERRGSIFHEVFPTPEHEQKLSSQSSSVPLDFHTEMVFHPFSPDYLLLYGLRQDRDKQARTSFSGIRRIHPFLPEEAREALFAESFTLAFAHIHGPYIVDGNLVSACKTPGPSVSVLYGDRSDPYLRFEADLMAAQTSEAAAALKVLQDLVNRCRREVVIEPGCLLILDNRRCVHARSVFPAYFDGADRWLRRMHVARSLDPSSSDRELGSRVIDTDIRAGWARRA
jgi:hypothetical protein